MWATGWEEQWSKKIRDILHLTLAHWITTTITFSAFGTPPSGMGCCFGAGDGGRSKNEYTLNIFSLLHLFHFRCDQVESSCWRRGVIGEWQTGVTNCEFWRWQGWQECKTRWFEAKGVTGLAKLCDLRLSATAASTEKRILVLSSELVDKLGDWKQKTDRLTDLRLRPEGELLVRAAFNHHLPARDKLTTALLLWWQAANIVRWQVIGKCTQSCLSSLCDDKLDRELREELQKWPVL